MNRRLEEEVTGSDDVPIADMALSIDSAAVMSGAVQHLAPFGASLRHGARGRPPAIDERRLRQRVGSPDGGDTVVCAPGAAAARTMDSSWFGASESPTNIDDALGDVVAAAKLAVSDSELPDSVDVVPDSELPDSVNVVPDSVDVVSDAVADDTPDSVEDLLGAVEDSVPDINEVVDCPRCRTFHAGGVFGEACRQARRNARKCTRCGLLHEDYNRVVQFLHGMEKFDCQFYIPVVEEIQMRGNTIILPQKVIQKLEEMVKMNKAKTSANANKEGAASKDEASNQ
jgi:hypothetical protein